jgi:hypothetical protein
MFSNEDKLDVSADHCGKAQWFMERVRDGARLRRVEGIFSDFYWQLITDCWNQSPDLRPSFESIVARLKANRSKYAFDGTNLEELIAYEGLVSNDGPVREASKSCPGVRRGGSNVRSFKWDD